MTKKQNHWSVLRYLIYFTQVGVSVVTPPILCCFAALWLKRRFALGNGTVIIGIVLGIAVAACSLRDFLRLTERKARESERKENGYGERKDFIYFRVGYGRTSGQDVRSDFGRYFG